MWLCDNRYLVNVQGSNQDHILFSLHYCSVTLSLWISNKKTTQVSSSCRPEGWLYFSCALSICLSWRVYLGSGMNCAGQFFYFLTEESYWKLARRQIMSWYPCKFVNQTWQKSGIRVFPNKMFHFMPIVLLGLKILTVSSSVFPIRRASIQGSFAACCCGWWKVEDKCEVMFDEGICETQGFRFSESSNFDAVTPHKS